MHNGIYKKQNKEFDEYQLFKGYDKQQKSYLTETLEGKITQLLYVNPAKRSTLEIFRNYKRSIMSSQSFPKRFYKDVAVSSEGGDFTVTLDGRTLKTPGKTALNMSRKDHAALVAAEWDAVTDAINPAHMPITRLMNVAVERTPKIRDDLIAEVRRYAGTDLLCYRADNPAGLIARQNKIWSPWLVWAEENGIALKTTDSVIAVTQDDAALDAAAARAAKYDDVALTLLVHLTAVYGSAILALAVMDGALDAGEAFDISRLDHNYQIQHWDEDPDPAEITPATRAATITLATLS